MLQNEQKLLEARADLGFGDASHAPEWVKARVVEIRSALLAKKPVPAVTPAQVDEILKRVAARQGEEIARCHQSESDEIALLRTRLARQGEEIRRQALGA